MHSRLLIAACMVLSLAGCNEETAPQQTAVPAPAVGIMTVEPRDIPYSENYHAQTIGSRAVELRAQVSGILVSRDYQEGSYVKKGQLLFTIEPDKYRAALKQAQGVAQQARAKYTQAKQDWDRIKPLYERNAVSQRDRDLAKAAFEGAKADMFSADAAVDAAKINYDNAYVRSPLDGFASKERHSVGNLINASSNEDGLLTVVNKVDPIYVNFSIPSPIYMRMRTLWDQKRLRMDDVRAHIHLADGSLYPIEGKVSFLDTAVNPSTSVVSARAEFPNPKLFVLPGQFVRLTTSGVILTNAIVVPQQAILQTQQGTMVTVVNSDGNAELRSVALNLSMGEWFLVDSGLNAGDRVVVEGINRCAPGAPVRIDEAMTKHVAETLVIPSPTSQSAKQ